MSNLWYSRTSHVFFFGAKGTRPGKRWPSNSTFTNDLVSLSSGVFGVKPYKTWQKSEFWRHLGVTTDCFFQTASDHVKEACWHIFALNLHLQLLGEWIENASEISKSYKRFSRLSCQHFIRKWKVHANSHWFKLHVIDKLNEIIHQTRNWIKYNCNSGIPIYCDPPDFTWSGIGFMKIWGTLFLGNIPPFTALSKGPTCIICFRFLLSRSSLEPLALDPKVTHHHQTCGVSRYLSPTWPVHRKCGADSS